MKRPSKKWLAAAAAGCIFASSMGTYTYQVLADEFVYSDTNVSITSIVDRYIEQNGEVFTTATPENATATDTVRTTQEEFTQAALGDATSADAVATGSVREVMKVTIGTETTEMSSEEQAEAAEETTTEATTEMSSEELTEVAEETTAEVTTETTTEATTETTTEATTETTTEATTEEEAVASPVQDFSGKAIVTASGTVNIRESGDTSAKKVGTIASGGILNVVEKGDTWSHITSGSVDGYIKNEFIAFDSDAASYASANLSKAAIVNTAALKLRGEPNTDSETLTLLAQGESYPILEIGDAWTKIQVDSAAGYVKNEYIMISYIMPTAQAEAAAEEASEETTTEAATTETTTEAATTEAPATDTTTSIGAQIASYACQFVGNPYVYGGTSLTNGADCSGFVQSVFANFGYSLPRTADTQSGTGTQISLAELQPGDLVFYDHGSGSVEHVGIYIGNGQIVHASNARTGIKISNVNYSTPFKACRIAN